MQVTTIKFMKRKNLGNYEHEEISMEAVLQEGEDAGEAALSLMSLVSQALQGEIKAEPSKKPAPVSPEKVQHVKDSISGAEAQINYGGVAIPPVIEEKAAPKRRRAAAPATEVSAKVESPSENAGGASTVVGHVDTANVSHVQSETPKASASLEKGTVVYDSKIKEHRSRFATYLGNTFPNWKPDAKFGVTDSPAKAEYAEKVRVFSGNLHGKAFEDSKGNMLESFKAELASFFGK